MKMLSTRLSSRTRIFESIFCRETFQQIQKKIYHSKKSTKNKLKSILIQTLMFRDITKTQKFEQLAPNKNLHTTCCQFF